MRFGTLRALGAAVLVSALAACGGGSGRGGTDVAVTGSGPTAPVAGGDTVDFVVAVENRGDHDADAVRLVTTLGGPLALRAVACSAAAGGAVCPAATGPSMTVPTLPSGGRLTFTVTARVDDGASGVVVASFAASLDDDTDRSNNTLTLSADAVSPRADLVVDGSGPDATVAAGGEAVFTMTLRNAGPDAARDVRIVDTVGSNLVLRDIACTASPGAACPAAMAPAMTVATLPAGASLVFTVRAAVNAGAADGTVVNQLSATAAADVDRGNSSAVAAATLRTPRSGVSVTVLSAPAAPVPAGGSAAFVMQVANGGPDAATRVRITDSVSANLAFRAAQCQASGGAVCPTTLSPSMTVDALPAGGALAFTVNTVAAADADGAITNTMTVAAANDPDASDDSATAVGSAFATAVAVQLSAPAGPLPGGGSAAFGAVVRNTGPSTANAVPIAITAGTGLTLSGAIGCTAAGGAQCPATTGAAMTAPSIPAGGALNLTIPVVARAGANGSATLTVAADAAGDRRDADDAASASVTVVSADLGASIAAAGAETAAGEAAVFTATVANPGASAASGVTIRHALSGAGAAGARATVTCRDTTTGANCWSAAANGEVTLPTLPAGRSLELTITVPLAGTARGAVTSTITVAAAGDPDASNNQASATTAAVDARNGVYAAFTAGGATTRLTLDLDAARVTPDGAAARSFTTSGGEQVVAGAQRLRLADDLVVGQLDLGGTIGVQPFVAARRFATTLADAQGSYNLVRRSGGTTRVGSAAIGADGTMYVCLRDNGVPVPVGGCPQDALSVYALSLAGDVFTATPRSAGASRWTFQVARSGGVRVLVAASGAALTIALIDPPALPGGTLRGPDTTGAWLQLALSQESYAATPLSGPADSAQLLETPSNAGSSMRIGARRSDNARLYVMQAGALAIVAGAASDAANGLLQIAVP